MSHKKPHLPTKICATCDRPFTWRKRWAACWESVRYCSEACRRRVSQAERTRTKDRPSRQGNARRSPSEEEWNDALATKGITPDGLREQLKRGIMIKAFVENEVVSKIEITDAQGKAFYDEHPEAFSKPE
jgi:hypothetical protein